MKVIIYGQGKCPNCASALKYAESKGHMVEYKIVGQDITKEQLEESIGREIRTVPQIFIYANGFSEYIGGYNELKERFK